MMINLWIDWRIIFGQKQSKHVKTDYFKEANVAAFEASKKSQYCNGPIAW